MTTTAHDTLIERVRELAAARVVAADSAAHIKSLRERFDAENAAIIAQAKADAERVAQMETALRAVAAEAYQATQVAKLAPGVEVKLYDRMTYIDTEALAWAREKNMALVPESLDRKAFEKIAKATELPFVVYTKEPRVQIATDLDKALASAGSDA